MSELSPKAFHRMVVAAGAATALFAGFAAAPALFSNAKAAEIVVAPPTGAPMSFADLVQRVSPAVVSIAVRGTIKPTNPNLNGQDLPYEDMPPGFEEFLRRFGAPDQQQPRETMGLGSGFFISEKGVIVTNNHVIEDADEIKVKTSDGKEYDAELVGTDALTDIAVLRVKKPDRAFPYVTFDREADLRVGDWVVAVGNPFGLEGTATAGIVSAKGRRDVGSGNSYVDFLQIDAPINRGNSGGPAFDLKGRVVGVNSAIFSPTGGSVGIGFAIPSETAAEIVDTLLNTGKVTRGWIGVQVQPLDDDLAKSLGLAEAKGAMVAGVVDDGPAAKAGIQQGDVILTVDGKQIEDSRDLTRKVGAYGVGQTAKVELLRAGNRKTVNLKLAERPGELQLAGLSGKGGGLTAPNAAPEQTKQAGLGLEVRVVSADERERLDLEPTEGGLYITKIEPTADLARKGVRPGDIIIEAGGQALRSPSDLSEAVAEAQKAQRPVLLQIEGRGGRRFVAAEVKAS